LAKSVENLLAIMLTKTHATRRTQTDAIVLGIGTEWLHVQSRAYI